MRLTGEWRMWRGAVVGAAIVLISAASHVLAGGRASFASPIFLVLAAASVVGGIVWSDREWTTSRLLLALGGGQLVIHVVMQVRLFPSPLHGVATAASTTGMDMSATAGTQAARSMSGTFMVLAHIVAVLISVLLLRRGERWLLEVRARAARLLPRAPRRAGLTLPVIISAPILCCSDVVAAPASVRDPVTRRGPPVAA